MRRKPRHLAACCALAALAASGCSVLGGGPGTLKVDQFPAERPQADMTPITGALEMMRNLPAGDPARQAELFQATKDAAALSPTTSNKLKYALALAIPGHSGANPVAAQRQLSELLATPETLLPVERLLAIVELQEVDQRLILQQENKLLRDEAQNESREKLQAITRRLSVESDENLRLRKALDEAQAKLEAVTHIERSINDRGATAPRAP